MQKEKAIEIAAPYFENHTVDTFHITSDEQAFFDEPTAKIHAQGLKDQEVMPVRRSDVKLLEIFNRAKAKRENAEELEAAARAHQAKLDEQEKQRLADEEATAKAEADKKAAAKAEADAKAKAEADAKKKADQEAKAAAAAKVSDQTTTTVQEKAAKQSTSKKQDATETPNIPSV